ncbi:GntR family transcriptional regulator [Paraburkholderia sp.]|uniref:GntR family transcriptional regulator n=1 Tax=Paraburkholderia sp. TaxID=1926495 RepID=UPI0039C9E2A2
MLAELEAACAKLATRRIGPDEAAALKQVHQESLAFEETGDVQGYARCNARFHEILYHACRNAPLAAEIARIRSRTRVYRRSVFQNQLRIRRSREDHGRILEAILSATGDHARCGSMHTPAPSRCVFHRTDDRRIGRVNQNPLDARAEALCFEQLPVFCGKQPRAHACALRAELGDGFLLRREIQILGDNWFADFLERLARHSHSQASWLSKPVSSR